MKRFNNLKMVLFDSTNASFKLAVEAGFVRGNQQTGYRDLVYISQSGTANLNPNIYLTFTYKSEDPKPVYMSYPQLFRVREIFEKIKDLVADLKGFTKAGDQLVVKQEYLEPVVLANIGKANNYISLKLEVIQYEENGILTRVPGVALSMSTCEPYSSVLTVDEFLTVYTIIKDIDLASLQCQLSLAFLEGAEAGFQAQPTYAAPAPAYTAGYMQQPQAQYNGYAAPQAPKPNYTQTQGYTKPYYNNNSYQAQQPKRQFVQNQTQQIVQQPSAPQPQEQQGFRGSEERSSYIKPREEKRVMSLESVEETPVSTIDIDDSSAIDDIFND